MEGGSQDRESADQGPGGGRPSFLCLVSRSAKCRTLGGMIIAISGRCEKCSGVVRLYSPFLPSLLPGVTLAAPARHVSARFGPVRLSLPCPPLIGALIRLTGGGPRP